MIAPDLFTQPETAIKKQAFEKFHSDNPNVYALFKRFAFQLMNAGVKKMGAKLIIERIRYETAIKTKGDDFKINNNHTCYYSRLFIFDYPEYKRYFTFKSINN